MVGLGVDHRSVPADIGYFADLFERIEIEHHDPAHGTTAANVQPATVRIRVNIVEPAVAANFRHLQHFVGTAAAAGG